MTHGRHLGADPDQGPNPDTRGGGAIEVVATIEIAAGIEVEAETGSETEIEMVTLTR